MSFGGKMIVAYLCMTEWQIAIEKRTK